MCVCLLAPIAAAQDAPDDAATPNGELPAVMLTAEDLVLRQSNALAEEGLTEEQRARVVTLFEAAQADLTQAQVHRESASRYAGLMASASATVSQLNRQAWQAVGVSVLDEFLPDDPSLAELEQALTAVQARGAQQRNTLTELEAEDAVLETRPVALREAIATEQQRLVDLSVEAGGAAAEEGAAALRSAVETSFEARGLVVQARLSSLELELASLPDRQRVQKARIGLARVQLAKVEEATATLTDQASARRRADAARELAQSKREAAQLARSHPMLSAYAEMTTDFSRSRSETVELAEALIDARLRAERRSAAFEENRESLTQVLEIGAVGEDFADLLRELRANLPETASIRSMIARRDEAMIDTRLQRLRIQERLRRLAYPDEVALSQITEWAGAHPADPPLSGAHRAELSSLMERRFGVLVQLESVYSTYIERLDELNAIDQTLVDNSQALSRTLDERLLWLPSAAPIGPLWFERVNTGLAWLTSVANWRIAGQTLAKRAGQMPLPTGLVLLLSVVLLVMRRRFVASLGKIAESVGHVWGDNFWLTIRALLITVLLALPVSLLVVWVGVLLYRSSGGLFATALGGGLINAGVVLYLLRFFQVLCKTNGLIEVHFRWSERARTVLSSNLWWLIFALFPAALIVPMTELSADIYLQNGLGRLLFLTASAALSIFLFRVLHPHKGMAAASLANKGLLWKTRLIWFPVLAAAPLLLGVVAAIGYYQTALKIQGQLFTSAWVALVGLICYSLAMRWLVVAHRRLAVARAREQRQKQIAASQAAAGAEGSGEAVPTPQMEAPAIDLSSVSTQTRALLRATIGACFFFLFYLIWRDLIPALGVLDEVSLWSSTVSTPDGDEVSSITVWSLIVAMVITTLTVIAARNLPGVLEITLLQRLSMDAGTRYAVTAISRYLIMAVGLFIAFDTIGISWGKMQFIVAALGVGLGFGLQEIVANFVSGIIILFERPIRVGDTVTVNDLSGNVARIQIRATTIIDLDNREILVPNKSFITSNVINWTLTDPITRINIRVGIAYGSDTALAHKVITEVVKASSLVLDLPKPAILFVGFGESSLDFDVRVFVKDFQHRWPVRHELHMAMDQALREAGIEIPFPQRDLHLRSSDVPLGGGGALTEETPGQEPSPDA